MNFPFSSPHPGVSTRLRKRVFPLIVCVTIFIFGLYLLARGASLPHSLWSNDQVQGVDPHPLANDLGLTIVAVPGSHPTIRVTVTNFHPETSVALLTWDTPLDDDALRLGVFEITDISTKQSLDLPLIAKSYNSNPTESALYDLAPRHAVTKDIILDVPGLQRGHVYEIHAHGTWSAIWNANVKVIGSERLKKMGGGFGLWRREFQSEKISIFIE